MDDDPQQAIKEGCGREQVLAFWKALGERWEDLRIERERWIAHDHVVLMLGRLIARGVASGVTA